MPHKDVTPSSPAVWRLRPHIGIMPRVIAMVLLLLAVSVEARAFWDPVTAECRPPALVGTAEAIDGDTLRFTRESGTVAILRLVSIDAPELYQTCRVDGAIWDCGLEARATLAALVEGRTLACLPCTYDHDGAREALCRDGDTDIGKELLRAGMATSHAYFANNLQSAESQARSAARGVWRGDWVHPDAWRQGERLGEGPCSACLFP